MKVPKDKNINLRSAKALEIDTSLMNKLIKTKIASDAAFDQMKRKFLSTKNQFSLSGDIHQNAERQTLAEFEKKYKKLSQVINKILQ